MKNAWLENDWEAARQSLEGMHKFQHEDIDKKIYNAKINCKLLEELGCKAPHEIIAGEGMATTLIWNLAGKTIMLKMELETFARSMTIESLKI